MPELVLEPLLDQAVPLVRLLLLTMLRIIIIIWHFIHIPLLPHQDTLDMALEQEQQGRNYLPTHRQLGTKLFIILIMPCPLRQYQNPESTH